MLGLLPSSTALGYNRRQAAENLCSKETLIEATKFNMDPVSAVGLVASIVTLISTTTSAIEYLNTTKDAPKESKGFLHEVLCLIVILDALRSKVRDADSAALWVKQVCLLAEEGGPLDRSKNVIDQQERKLKTGTKIQMLGKAHIWPLTKKDNSELLAKVERLKNTIEIALHHDHS